MVIHHFIAGSRTLQDQTPADPSRTTLKWILSLEQHAPEVLYSSYTTRLQFLIH